MKLLTNIGKRTWKLTKDSAELKPGKSQGVEDEIADKYAKSYPRDLQVVELEKEESEAKKPKPKKKAADTE